MFLRLGSALVAWMLLYAYVLWLAALHALACGPDGDEMHRLLLGILPLVLAAIFLLRATKPMPEVHRTLRWLSLPLFLLLPLCLLSLWDVFQMVNLESAALCADFPPPVWQQLWTPLQLAILSLLTYKLLTAWRGDKNKTS